MQLLLWSKGDAPLGVRAVRPGLTTSIRFKRSGENHPCAIDKRVP
jgi:hypothetical protein